LISILINWGGAQFGFADSPVQHLQDVLTIGPTLAIFGALLTHSTNRGSALYLFAARYHAVVTLAITIGLVGLFLWTFRHLLWRRPRDREADLRAALAENR
jgi:uncharacterized membrane protein